ncbi:hypothetical protein DVV91_10280 [Clostridium botulinum]|uniref:hypothetical protein n=1 Tax=Clostridium TaxID=1485 RepID=UPI0013EEC7CA|nr:MULTISPECIES: hypothetical protein [Clostridium]MBN1074729.1 hypothetical protein [Clostridium botulinum]MBZ9693321.1 hypothetical protein [Clostridium sp. M14]
MCKFCKEYKEYKEYKTSESYRNRKVVCYNKDCIFCRDTNICGHGHSKCKNRKVLFNALDLYKKGLIK